MSLSQIKVNNQVVTNVDNAPTLDSSHLVSSGGVFDEIEYIKTQSGMKIFEDDPEYEGSVLDCYLDKTIFDELNIVLEIADCWNYYTTDEPKLYIRYNSTFLQFGDGRIFKLFSDFNNYQLIYLYVSNTIVGYIVFKDKDKMADAPSRNSGAKMNLDFIIDKKYHQDINIPVIQNDINLINEQVSFYNNIIFSNEHTEQIVYQKEGEIDYYSQFNVGYNAAIVGCCTKNSSYDITYNKIIVYVKGYVPGKYKWAISLSNKCDSSFNYSLASYRTFIEQGEFQLSDAYEKKEIYLSKTYICPKGYGIVFTCGFNNVKGCSILGSSNNEGVWPYDIYGNNPQRIMFWLQTGDVEEILQNTNFHLGSIDVSVQRGYIVSQPILCLEDTIIRSKDVEEICEEIIEQKIPDIVDEVSSEIDLSINVNLPDKIYAVAGDKLQLFYRGIIEAVEPYTYDIDVRCAKGAAYPRYFEYGPSNNDIGTSENITINVRNQNGKILGTKTSVIESVGSPQSPASNINIFTFGDSLTSGGDWPNEMNRRLTASNSNIVDNIRGRGLTNITFCGSKVTTQNGITTDYFGVGGWQFSSYCLKGAKEYRVYVSNVSSVEIGSKYSNNGNTYTISEVNVTSGTGNLLLTGNESEPQQSGVLTKVSGNGDATITFSSYELENANPLWDVENNKMSFIPYVNQCGNGQIDVVYVLLSWNGQSAWREWTLNDLGYAKTFARTLHNEYSNAKLKLMGIQMPSNNGGLGANYGATGSYTDRYGLYYCAFRYNDALKALCNDSEFSSYCEYVNTAAQFDSENNMPNGTYQVNIRNSSTETRGTNGVHPAICGYYQIADAAYRNFVANFCQ